MVYTYCENSFSGDTYFNRVKSMLFFSGRQLHTSTRYQILRSIYYQPGTMVYRYCEIVSTVIHIKSSEKKLFLRTPYPNVVQKVSLLFY